MTCKSSPRTRLGLVALWTAVALALSGCSLLFDTVECECDEDCEKFEGTPRCRNNVCVRGPTVIPLDTSSPTDVTDTGEDTPDLVDADDTDLDDAEVADADLDDADGELEDADIDVDADDVPTPPTRVVVTDDITTDTVWTADHLYVLERPIFVTFDSTLTIEPGTRIHGGRGAADPLDPLSRVGGALVVTRGSRLFASGTRDEPIVFTSDEMIGERAAGDWGGIVLLGRAPINVAGGTAAVEGIPDSVGLANRSYGGLEPQGSCGLLRHVRIEFAGYELAPGNELNGLTMAGCGSQTVVRNLQVHRALDDGIEIFGGTTPLRNVVVSQAIDDGLDWDQGWTGSAQFVVVFQGGLGDKALEGDNATADPAAAPVSAPLIYNATLVGPGVGGVKLRTGSAATLVNALILDQTTGLDLQGPTAVARLIDAETEVRASLLSGHTTPHTTSGLEACALFVEHEACLSACDPPDDAACIDACRATTRQNHPDAFVGLSMTEIEAFFDTLTAPHPRCDEVLAVDLDVALGDLLESDPGLADPSSPLHLYPLTTDSPLTTGETPPDFDAQGNELAPNAQWIGALEPADDTTWLDGWTDFPAN